MVEPFDVWKVGVRIALQNEVSGGLTLIAKQLTGIHLKTKDIEAAFKSWQVGAALAGGAMIGAGLGIADVYKTITDHGRGVLHQQDALIRAGRTHAEVAQLTADAYKNITKAVPTATTSDVLRVAAELTTVKGSWEHALTAIPASLKLEALISNLTGE